MQFRGTGSTAYECLFVPIQASIERISPKDKKFGLCLTGVRPRSEAEVEDPGFPASGTTPPPLCIVIVTISADDIASTSEAAYQVVIFVFCYMICEYKRLRYQTDELLLQSFISGSHCRRLPLCREDRRGAARVAARLHRADLLSRGTSPRSLLH